MRDHSKMHYSGLYPTKEIRAMTAALKAVKGLTVEDDREAGTIRCSHKDVVLFASLQKGRGGPWITRMVPGLIEVHVKGECRECGTRFDNDANAESVDYPGWCRWEDCEAAAKKQELPA